MSPLQSGGTATVTFRDQASATIDASSIQFAGNATAGSSAVVRVESDANVFVNSLNMASGTAGSDSITGTGSTLTQQGTSTLTVGGTGTSSGTVIVESNGTFSTGSGLTAIQPNGRIDVQTGGRFNAVGDTTTTT